MEIIPFHPTQETVYKAVIAPSLDSHRITKFFIIQVNVYRRIRKSPHSENVMDVGKTLGQGASQLRNVILASRWQQVGQAIMGAVGATHPISLNQQWARQNLQPIDSLALIYFTLKNIYPVQQKGYLVGQIYSEIMSKTVCKIQALENTGNSHLKLVFSKVSLQFNFMNLVSLESLLNIR